MGLRSAGASRRDKSSRLQFVKRIPSDIKQLIVGKTLTIPVGGEELKVSIKPSTQAIRFSLRTGNPLEAKIRYAEALAYIEQMLEGWRSGRLIDLSHRQVTALAGAFYRAWSRGPDGPGASMSVEARGGLPVDPDDELEADFLEVERGAGTKALEHHKELTIEQRLFQFSGLLDGLLASHGVPSVTETSRRQLLNAMVAQLAPARETFSRVLGGDYSPDPRLAAIPAWEEPSKPPQGVVSLDGLVKGWEAAAKEANLAEMTITLYTGVFERLGIYLKHDDAAKITVDDVLRYKDWRLAGNSSKSKRGLSPSSFKTLDLAAMNSVFVWAMEKGKLRSNPAASVTVKVPKKTKVREKEFTPEEAQAILLATAGWRDEEQAFYWVPWLCAYSGCRVGEAMQLRKEDIRHASGVWHMRITPEAGTVKTKEYRDVPIHSHIIELGFPDFVKAAKKGHLFVRSKPEEALAEVRKAVGRLTKRVRDVVSDPHVSPNHGWRHTFKSIGFDAGIQEKVLDAICGHKPASEGQKYGSISLKAKLDAITRFPRFEVTETNGTDGAPR